MAPNAARWIGAWAGGPPIGIANGVAREAIYSRRVSERTAHQVSSVTAVAAFAAYFDVLERRWPLPSAGVALKVGAAWTLLTVAFEFGFGRLAAEQSWETLLADYNLAKGRTWPLVLAWITVGPAVVSKLHARRRTDATPAGVRAERPARRLDRLV